LASRVYDPTELYERTHPQPTAHISDDENDPATPVRGRNAGQSPPASYPQQQQH